MSKTKNNNLIVDVKGKWKLYSPIIPANSEAIGTVRTPDGQTGALVRFIKTGEYVQFNAGTYRRIDGRKVAAALGTSGSPRKMKDGKRINIYIDQKTIEKASKLGDGNISEGIRRAVNNMPEELLK